jgi:hypothetical protein
VYRLALAATRRIKKHVCAPITIHWRVLRDPVRGLTAAYQ